MSVFGKLNWSDVGKGVLLAFGSAFASGLYVVLEAGTLPTLGDFKTSAIAGLSAIAIYLLKNLFTNSSNQLLKTESSTETIIASGGDGLTDENKEDLPGNP